MSKICKFCGGEANQGGVLYRAPGGVRAFACWKDDCRAKYRAEYKERIAEEIAELKANNQCIFKVAWRGWCKAQGFPFCDKHTKAHCRVCGKQATQQCSYAGFLVCGIPLCDDCLCPSHGF